MAKTSCETSQVVDVLNALRKQGVGFEGPFRTAKGRIVLLIQDQIVVESELLDLFDSGRLNPAGIASLLRDLRAH